MVNMRIAICISGFIRTWKYTKRSFIEKLLTNEHEIDIFIHTYRENLHEFTAGEPDTIISDDQFKDLFEGLNIKGFVIEERSRLLPKLFEDSKKFENISNYGLAQKESSDFNSISIPIGVRTYDHLRKLWLCDQLRQQYEVDNNFKYDLVMKTRFDIMYFTTPKWKELKDGKLHCGYGATWGWPEDTICICEGDLMSLYAGRFNLLEEICFNRDGTIKSDSGICAHFSLKYTIEKYGLIIGEPSININCIRSKDSMQYYGNYRYKYNAEDLYNKLSVHRVDTPQQMEVIKRNLLG